MLRQNHKFLSVTLFFFFFVTIISSASAQGWVRQIWTSGGDPSPFYSEGAIVAGIPGARGDTSCFLMQVPDQENTYTFIWNVNGLAQYTSSILPLHLDDHHLPRSGAWVSVDSIVVLEELEAITGGNRRVGMTMFKTRFAFNNSTQRDSILWQTTIVEGDSIHAYAVKTIEAEDGSLWVLGETEPMAQPGDANLFLAKLNRNGEVLWVNHLDQASDNRGEDILQTIDGRVFILENRFENSLNEVWLLEVDNDGVLLNSYQLTTNSDNHFSSAMILTQDGSIAIPLVDSSGPNDIILLKVDLSGNIIWERTYPFPDQQVQIMALVEDPSSDIVMAGFLNDVNDENLAFLMKTSASGDPVWERRFGVSGESRELHHIIMHPEGGYLAGGRARRISSNPPHSYMIRTDINGIIKPGLIKGNVFHDVDDDCLPTLLDEPLDNWIVQAFRDSSTSFFANTDDMGNYRIECDTGDYIVSVITPNDYWQPCVNNQTVTIDYLDTALVDFAVQSVIDCPNMTVDHASGLVRPCDTTFFFVDYCNVGTVPSSGAVVEILLDSVFTYLSSQISPSNITDSLITFPLPDLGPGACNRFYFWATVSCDVLEGQITCSEAHIFPDSICTQPMASWSGAFIEAEGDCVGDSIRFQLINTGIAPTSDKLNYIVIEDAVLLMQGDFDLSQGEILNLPIDATGATYHLIAEQEPGAPGASQPLAAVEGCVGSSGNPPSIGFFNQFSQNDGDSYISTFCWPVTTSFDPNDKQAIPTGFDDEHFIFDYTELEYRIRFQNTGSDTAFRVILIDSLSPYLDPATIRPGASSHSYKFEIEDNGVLRFVFNNINLPHEDVDPDGSNGFVNFKVAQKKGNSIGRVVENAAAIYFDFNLPVITNKTRHTIHERLIQIFTNVNNQKEESIGIKVYPNPARGLVNFDLLSPVNGPSTFLLIDGQGRVVIQKQFVGRQYVFETGGLLPGVYYYQIVTDNAEGQTYVGKVVLW